MRGSEVSTSVVKVFLIGCLSLLEHTHTHTPTHTHTHTHPLTPTHTHSHTPHTHTPPPPTHTHTHIYIYIYIYIIRSLQPIRLFRLSHSFIFFWFHFVSLYIWLCVLCAAVWFCKLCIFTVMFVYSYCYVCSVLVILFHCAILCTVCV